MTKQEAPSRRRPFKKAGAAPQDEGRGAAPTGTKQTARPINWGKLARIADRAIRAKGETPGRIAARVGLSRRETQDLRHGDKLPALAYLRLCHYLGRDPVTLEPPAAGIPEFKGAVLWTYLAIALYGNRLIAELSVRDAAAQIGVSAATVSRVENGVKVDARSFLNICAWLDRHPNEMTGPPETAAGPGAGPAAADPAAGVSVKASRETVSAGAGGAADRADGPR